MPLILELEQLGTGAVRASSAHPQSRFKVLRLNRSQWKLAPEKPGIYLLIGFDLDGSPPVYIGQSESNKSGIRGRINDHRKKKSKEFFGEIFCFPMKDLAYCRAVEAELIKRAKDAESNTSFKTDNEKDEAQWQGAVPTQAAQVCDDIQEALCMLLGRDLFSDEAAAAPSNDGAGTKTQYNISLAELQDAKFLSSPQVITSKDGKSEGVITEDGGVEFDGASYTSLSKAASDAKVKKGQAPAVSGWEYWGIDRKGEFVDLVTIRAEYLAAK